LQTLQASLEAIAVVEQGAIAVEGVEHGHGIVDQTVGEALERRERVVPVRPPR
jgi:hypothetical protein